VTNRIPRGHRKSPLNHEPEAVLYARKKAKMTQAEAVADLSPIIRSTGHLSEIEKGTRSASDELLERMAVVYNCPLVMLERKRWSA
jgi:transcriptional regulator with XRE-family HTH domain